MKLLSIDPGSRKLGFAYFDGKELIKHDYLDLSKEKDILNRMRSIYEDLSHRLMEFYPAVVVLEAQKHFRNAKTARALNEVVGVIKICCLNFTVCEMQEVHPKTMKKAVTGNGGSDKELVLSTIKKMFKIEGDISEDTADAIGLGYAYLNKKVVKKRK